MTKIGLYVVVLIIAKSTLIQTGELTSVTSKKVNYLEPGEVFSYKPNKKYRPFFDNDLRTYCYRPQKKTLRRLFESLELRLDIDGDDYTQYDGATAEQVEEHYNEHRSLFSFTLFSQKRTRLQLSPFIANCLGIETVQSYAVHLQRTRIDFWRVVQMIVGCMIFHYAAKLSQNAIFYYIIGITLGICSSFMLLIWLTSKLIPRGPVMYGAIIGGWTIGVYILQILLENLQTIIVTYKSYVFWYIFTTGIISFFFCYRWGPPTNKRSRNIIKWILQLKALALIYTSSHYEEVNVAIILLTIIMHYVPSSMWHKCRTLWKRKFPPKRRLLTNAEYYEQGVRETTKALDELRTYASSPECKQWKMMTKLRDPYRFAAFVEGESHLRDEEFLHFESSQYTADVNEDDSDVSVDEKNHEDHIGHMEAPNNITTVTRTTLQSLQEISEDDDSDDGDNYNLRSTHNHSTTIKSPTVPSRQTRRNTPSSTRHNSGLTSTYPASSKYVNLSDDEDLDLT